MAGHQGPLGGIGQSLANAVDAAMIGRDQAVSIGEAGGDGQAGCARGGCQSSGDEFAAGKQFAHVCSFPAAPWPVIIARMRALKPASQTMAMWTRRKRTRKS